MVRRIVVIVFLALLVVTPGSSLQAMTRPEAPLNSSIQTVSQALVCPGFLPSRLVAGSQARVTPGLPNTLRSSPGGWATGQIPGGGVFTVLQGPHCTPGMAWWLEPVTSGGCSVGLPSRLAVGSQGRVTPGTPNTLRTYPGGWATGQIPGGGVFTVVEGPQCAYGMTWWLVNYRGAVGWTAEGSGSTYWLEPLSGCNFTLPPRMVVGGWGRVTPGLANLMRNGPSTANPVVGRIPAGGVFAVLSGPRCAAGMAWWQVSYRGIVGWTPEGQSSAYWIEPYR